jgi:hypothetical protein
MPAAALGTLWLSHAAAADAFPPSPAPATAGARLDTATNRRLGLPLLLWRRLEFGRFRTGCSGFRIACRSGNSSNLSAGRQMTKETLFLQALIDKELSPKCLKSSPKRLKCSPKHLKSSPKRLKSSPKHLKSSPKHLKSSPKGFDSSAQGDALGTRSPNHYQP